MLRSLLNLVTVVVLVFAIVRVAMPRTRRESPVAFEVRRAQWLSVAAGVVVAYLLVLAVAALGIGGVPDRRGMIVYLLLVAVVGVAVPVLRAAWRRVGAARRRAEEDSRQAAGLPRLEGADAPTPPHRGLSGEEEAPRRW